MNPRRYLATVAAFTIALFGCYYACFTYQLGAHVEAEWWLKHVYFYKDYVAEHTPSPKIIIFSGSNGLFGINSEIIEENTGLPVVNLAGHVNLDLDFFYVKLKKHIGQGDIVVLPLEFGHMQRDKFVDWFVNNMLAWGEDDYIRLLNPLDLFKFIAAVTKTRIYEGMLKQTGVNPIKSKDEFIADLERLHREQGAAWRGYSYKSLNRYGDIVSQDQMTEEFRKNSGNDLFYYGGWDIADRFIKQISKIRNLVRRYGGRVILTWSVTMKNKHFDLSTPGSQKNLEWILANLAKHSITIECDPEAFHFDRELFFDTGYHLNRRGTILRSENLAECIGRLIDPNG